MHPTRMNISQHRRCRRLAPSSRTHRSACTRPAGSAKSMQLINKRTRNKRLATKTTSPFSRMCVRDEKEYIVFVSCIVCDKCVCGMHNPPSRGIGLLEFALLLLPFVSMGINVYCFSHVYTAGLLASMNFYVHWRRYVFVMAPGAHNNNHAFACVVFVADLQTIGKMLPLPFFVLSLLLPVPQWACICLCGAFHSFVAVNAWNCPRTTRIRRNSWHNA